MLTVQYRRWCPPKSPLRIEFPPELLREVREEGARPASSLPQRWRPRFNREVNQSRGLLFGVKHDDEVRVLATRADAGLAPVGIFVCRARGEVFLTDDDLANFEKHHGALALVVAGGQAGFFVREPDGTVQSIRSHEEFRVADAATQPVPRAAEELPAPAPCWWQSRQGWKRIAACAGFLAVPAGALAYLEPFLPSLPISLAIREEAGQLRIGWNGGAPLEGSRLEIQDGGERTILMLAADTSSATYGVRGRDVEVRLTSGTRAGGAHWEAARFANKAAHRTPPASGTLRERISELMHEARSLRRSLAKGDERTRDLAAKMDAMTRREP